MFEDFRKLMDDDSFREEVQQEKELAQSSHQERYFLGMTPVQRFILAILLLMMVIVLGVLFLLVTSKIVPPFLG